MAVYSQAPPLRFPDDVRADLEAYRGGLADETEERFAPLARPCVAVTAERVGPAPLRRGLFGKVFGRPTAAPVLGPLASKFGGTPYAEADDDWEGHELLGQVDLAEATAVLPDGAPELKGLLRVDLGSPNAHPPFGIRVRWFPEPSLERAVPVSVPSVGKWETRLRFRRSWTLPEGDALEALWPFPDVPWFEYAEFYPPGYNEDGRDEFHRMLGHRSAGLDEPYGFTPPPGCDPAIEGYELLWRLTFDNTADFGWGTNWVYVLVPREDLAAGDLSRAFATAANG